MQSFSTGGFYERDEPEFPEHVAHFDCAFRQDFPFDFGIGVEMEDYYVRLVQCVVARTPGMDFENTHLRQANQSFLRGNCNVFFRTFVLFVRNCYALYSLRDSLTDMLLEEAGFAAAFGAAHDAERAPFNVRQKMIGYFKVVFGKLLFCQLALCVQYFVGMGQVEAFEGIGRLLIRLLGRFSRRRFFTSLWRLRHGNRLFATHLSRVLSVALPLVRRLAHTMVAGPGGKLHLGYQLRFYPSGVFLFFGGQFPRKRRSGLL